MSCQQPPGVFGPVIDRERCEGKADCLRVCPYQVFELATLTREQWSALSLRGRLKALVHGRHQAVPVRADQCHACGLCVAACPENAIQLVKREGNRP
ncbi:MAG: ferredoxin family protein [Proteobacteria bacterium]|nr:ferredoxin family protein [Pseudomonadota bacterium]